MFVYIIDISIKIGSASRIFLNSALKSFEKDIKKRYGANLVIAQDNPKNILYNLAKKYDINSIIWGSRYEPCLMKKDSEIKFFLKKQGLKVLNFNNFLLFDPNKIKNSSNQYFKVFTPFWKNCISNFSSIRQSFVAPSKIRCINIEGSDLSINNHNLDSLLKGISVKKDLIGLYDASEDFANNKLDQFCKKNVLKYKQERDFPNKESTSKLSPYLHYGIISPRQIFHKLKAFMSDENVSCFMGKIGWREFSYNLIINFPMLPHKNFNPKFDNFPWINDQMKFEKWKNGMVGYPIIDAGMRELKETGLMHNRVRMIVGSFLTKNLLIDWRLGQDWFWELLIDADLASNSASWQWIAGSGADASPYFRIFNPIRQSIKFDPSGCYIRKWVSELSNLSDSEIHFPVEIKSYPKPIVDLQKSRNAALNAYKECQMSQNLKSLFKIRPVRFFLKYD